MTHYFQGYSLRIYTMHALNLQMISTSSEETDYNFFTSLSYTSHEQT